MTAGTIMRRLGRFAFGLGVFVALAIALFSWSPKTLFDFDASHYTSIAHDIDRHRTFSNGLFDRVDSTLAPPPPGMFFGPVYPALVAAAMQIDPRFKQAVICWVTADARKQDGAKLCEPYAAPMLILHAVFLALGILAIARAGELMFRSEVVFWGAGLLATLGVLVESKLFSFVMTESVTFGLYAIFAWCCVVAWLRTRRRHCLIAGLVLGVLILHRPSHQLLLLVGVLIFALQGLLALRSFRQAGWRAAVFALGCLLVIVPWMARNATTLGKFALTEEYGSATIIERFAFNDMTTREFVLALPYCVPGVGEPVVGWLFGQSAMRRFEWDQPGSFFEVGRTLRGDLERAHGSLDAAIGPLIAQQSAGDWLKHAVVSMPLAWCGLWAGWVLSWLLLPLFAVAVWRAAWRAELTFLFYAAPAFAMLAAHALLANHYTRYNLALIGPFAIGAAWITADLARRFRRPRSAIPDR
jgi:hypothetical protein